MIIIIIDLITVNCYYYIYCYYYHKNIQKKKSIDDSIIFLKTNMAISIIIFQNNFIN